MTAQPESSGIFLASIALEPNRWRREPEKIPSLRVSEWSERAARSGFAGWELWEHHYLKAGEKERKALAASSLPVRIFNTYRIPGIDPHEDWLRVAEAVRHMGDRMRAIKFNLGKADVPVERQIEAALAWAESLPEDVRMLCECHPGTVLEDPSAAARAFNVWPADRFGAILHPMNRDPGHCERWLEALGSRIGHLHWQARNEENRICSLLDKRDQVARAVHLLAGKGFIGTQSIEFVEGTGRPGESPETLFAAAQRDLRTLLGLHSGEICQSN